MYMYMCTYIYNMYAYTLRERGVSGCWAPLSLSRPQIVERLRLRVQDFGTRAISWASHRLLKSGSRLSEVRKS